MSAWREGLATPIDKASSSSGSGGMGNQQLAGAKTAASPRPSGKYTPLPASPFSSRTARRTSPPTGSLLRSTASRWALRTPNRTLSPLNRERQQSRLQLVGQVNLELAMPLGLRRAETGMHRFGVRICLGDERLRFS